MAADADELHRFKTEWTHAHPPDLLDIHDAHAGGWGASVGQTFGISSQSHLPGCTKRMMAIDRKPILFTEGIFEVTFQCALCGAEMVRTVKPE
jgi:hypothetical protein